MNDFKVKTKNEAIDYYNNQIAEKEKQLGIKLQYKSKYQTFEEWMK